MALEPSDRPRLQQDTTAVAVSDPRLVALIVVICCFGDSGGGCAFRRRYQCFRDGPCLNEGFRLAVGWVR